MTQPAPKLRLVLEAIGSDKRDAASLAAQLRINLVALRVSLRQWELAGHVQRVEDVHPVLWRRADRAGRLAAISECERLIVEYQIAGGEIDPQGWMARQFEDAIVPRMFPPPSAPAPARSIFEVSPARRYEQFHKMGHTPPVEGGFIAEWRRLRGEGA